MWIIDDGGNPEAFQDLKGTSDRAAGIVAAAFLDEMIKDRLKSALHRDSESYTEKIMKETFRPDHTLGSFGSRVDMAYLMGIFSVDAHRDLVTIGKIRNLLAHYPEHYSFATERIAALCLNLKIVVARVRPPTDGTTGFYRQTEPDDFWFSIRGNPADELAKPRERFTWTAKIFVAALDPSWKLHSALPLI